MIYVKEKRTRTAANAAKIVMAKGFTSIKDATRQIVELLDPDDPERIVLEYLLEKAVGIKNAKTWKEIGEMLARKGIRMKKKEFQNTVLKTSRKGPHFIGSCREGYFIIDSHEDFVAMYNFYKTRIRQEVSNRNKLLEIGRETGMYDGDTSLLEPLPNYMLN